MNIKIFTTSIILVLGLQSSLVHADVFDNLEKFGNKLGKVVGSTLGGVGTGMAGSVVETTNLVKAATNSTHKRQQQKKLNHDQKRTKVEGLLIGVAGGGLLGHLLGDSKKSARNGAIAGGLIGLIAGHEIAKIKKSNALAQDKLNQQIRILDASIRNTKQHNQNTRKLTQLTQIRISRLGRNKQGKLALAREITTVIQKKQNVIRQQKVALRNHQNLIAISTRQAKQKKEKVNPSRNNIRTAQLKRELNMLQRSVTQLANMKTQMMANINS